MKRVSWTGLLVLLSAASLVAWLLYRTARQSSVAPTADAEPISGQNDFAKRLAAVEAETVNVRRELGLARVAAGAVLAAVPPSAPSSLGEANNVSGKQSDREGLRDRQAIAMAAYEDELEFRAAGEPADRAWTATVESRVRGRLTTLKGRIAFQSASCGTSFCRAVIWHEDSRAHADLLTELRKGRDPGRDSQILMRRHTRPAGGYSTTLYISKAGQRLPALNEALAAR